MNNVIHCMLLNLFPISVGKIESSFEFDNLIIILRCGDLMMKAMIGKGEWHLTLKMMIYSCLPLDRYEKREVKL